MSDNNTQPLTPDMQAEVDLAAKQKILDALMGDPRHIHGPFMFLLNQNHNALRGCVNCGATWVGVMAGSEDTIRWHEVQEPEEEDDKDVLYYLQK